MSSPGRPFGYVMPELTVAISEASLERWRVAAAAGARIIYANGPTAMRDDSTFIRVRQLTAAGELLIFQRRTADGRFDFIAERRIVDTADAPIAVIARQLTGKDALVYALLRNIASLANFCPTNAEIAGRLELSDHNTRGAQCVSDRIKRLRELGLIRVEGRGPLQRRIVTIVESGDQTAPGRIPVKGRV